MRSCSDPTDPDRLSQIPNYGSAEEHGMLASLITNHHNDLFILQIAMEQGLASPERSTLPPPILVFYGRDADPSSHSSGISSNVCDWMHWWLNEVVAPGVSSPISEVGGRLG